MEIGLGLCFIFLKDRQHVPSIDPGLPKQFVAHWNYEKIKKKKPRANTKKRWAYTRMCWFWNALANSPLSGT